MPWKLGPNKQRGSKTQSRKIRYFFYSLFLAGIAYFVGNAYFRGIPSTVLCASVGLALPFWLIYYRWEPNIIIAIHRIIAGKGIKLKGDDYEKINWWVSALSFFVCISVVVLFILIWQEISGESFYGN